MKYLIKFESDDFPYYCQSLTEFTAVKGKARVFATKKEAKNYLFRVNRIKKLLEANPRVLEV